MIILLCANYTKYIEPLKVYSFFKSISGSITVMAQQNKIHMETKRPLLRDARWKANINLNLEEFTKLFIQIGHLKLSSLCLKIDLTRWYRKLQHQNKSTGKSMVVRLRVMEECGKNISHAVMDSTTMKSQFLKNNGCLSKKVFNKTTYQFI